MHVRGNMLHQTPQIEAPATWRQSVVSDSRLVSQRERDRQREKGKKGVPPKLFLRHRGFSRDAYMVVFITAITVFV